MFLHVTAMNMKTFPEGALKVSPVGRVYELSFSVEETITCLSGAVAHTLSPMAKSLITALEGIGGGVGIGADVDEDVHE